MTVALTATEADSDLIYSEYVGFANEVFLEEVI